jgi:GAF domain-containing protein
LRGEGYVRIEPDERGWLWSDRLGLYLGVKDGRLRYFTAEGLLVPTPEEGEEQERQRAEQEWQRAEQERQRAEQERQRAEQERQRAEQERQRADLLAEKLRALGLDPDSL